MSSTSKFIGPLLHFLLPDAPDETIQIYHGYIRKASHFAAYAILALLATRSFLTSSVSELRSYWHWAAICLVLLIASLDELNQSSSLLRTGSFFDVMLDIFGGLCAIGFVHAVPIRRDKDLPASQ